MLLQHAMTYKHNHHQGAHTKVMLVKSNVALSLPKVKLKCSAQSKLQYFHMH